MAKNNLMGAGIATLMAVGIAAPAVAQWNPDAATSAQSQTQAPPQPRTLRQRAADAIAAFRQERAAVSGQAPVSGQASDPNSGSWGTPTYSTNRKGTKWGGGFNSDYRCENDRVILLGFGVPVTINGRQHPNSAMVLGREYYRNGRVTMPRNYAFEQAHYNRYGFATRAFEAAARAGAPHVAVLGAGMDIPDSQAGSIVPILNGIPFELVDAATLCFDRGMSKSDRNDRPDRRDPRRDRDQRYER